MAEPVHVDFYIQATHCNEKFIKDIIALLLNVNAKYYEPGESEEHASGYWSDKREDWFWERPIDEAIKVLSEDGGGSIQFWCVHLDLAFTVRIRPSLLEPSDVLGRVGVSVDPIYFYSGEHGRDWFEFEPDEDGEILERCRFLVKLSKLLYNFLKPYYGFGEPIFDYSEFPRENDIVNLNVHNIYWANFFSPKIVEKIGREKLLSIKAWKVEQLEDGGILILMSPNPLYWYHDKGKEIEKQLGLR